MARNRSSLDDLHGGRIRVPRSRGAVSGFLLILLGAWGALIPFIGPYFNFGYTPNTTWTWTSARFWLEVLPGAVTVLGGLLLLVGANRITTSFGGWLAAAGGAWFVVGPTLASLLHLGSIGSPISSSSGPRAIQTLALFPGLGALILLIAGTALGRLSVVGIRDVRAAERRAEQEREDEEAERVHLIQHSNYSPEPTIARADVGPSDRARAAGTPTIPPPPPVPPSVPPSTSPDGATRRSGSTRIEP